VDAATWTAAGSLVLIEMVVGFRDRLKPRDFLTQTAIGTVLGLLVIALRALLH